MLQDIRFAFRTLLRDRAFTVVAIATLAIALGANTAIFTIVNAILLEPLPYAAPERLVKVRTQDGTSDSRGDQLSYPNIRDIRQLKSVQDVFAYTRSGMFLMETEDPLLLRGTDLEANGLPLLGIKPVLGRFFTAAEDRPGAEPVVILSHELWKGTLGGDKSIIGRRLRFGPTRFRTVIGVMPPEFKFPANVERSDYYAPMMPDISEAEKAARGMVFMDAVARLKPGATHQQAANEAAILGRNLEKSFPSSNTGLRYLLTPLHDAVVAKVKPALIVLFGAVAAVLLIGCANVANLLLARASTRNKEMSIRSAVGATRQRIVRQLLIESLILSLIAGACGLLLALWGVAGLTALAPNDIPRLDNVQLDGRVVAFTLGLSLLTGILFGLAPALSASSTDLTESLKEGSRGSTEGRARNRVRNILVTAAIAMSLMLLAGAGLLMRSFVRLNGVNPGFDYSNLAVLEISPRAIHDTPEKVLAFHDRLRSEISSLPGVEAVSGANMLPLGGNENIYSFEILGRPPFPEGRGPSITTIYVRDGFLRTMGIRLLKGRDVLQSDHATSRPVLVVSSAFAQRFFPAGDALGKEIELSCCGGSVRTIVGISDDIRYLDLAEEPEPMFFVPFAQTTDRFLSVIVKSPTAEALAPSLRAVVRRIDRLQPIVSLSTLEEMRAKTLATRKFSLTLITALSVIALILAAGGIYSIMSYSVAQRTSEIGIRMALGAEARQIFRLIVGNALKLVLIGLAVGLACALAASRLLRSLLYQIEPGDPVTFASICVMITAVALLASWIPARRASRVDPQVAMRYD